MPSCQNYKNMRNSENKNRVRTSRKVIVNGKTVEDETFEQVQIDSAHSETNNERRGTDPGRMPLNKGKMGSISSVVSIVAGCLTIAFASAPLLWNWFVVLAWLIVPLGAISLIAAAVCFFCKKKALALCGIALSILGVIIAICNARTYALASANSVNDITSLAKTFIDALANPFK